MLCPPVVGQLMAFARSMSCGLSSQLSSQHQSAAEHSVDQVLGAPRGLELTKLTCLLNLLSCLTLTRHDAKSACTSEWVQKAAMHSLPAPRSSRWQGTPAPRWGAWRQRPRRPLGQPTRGSPRQLESEWMCFSALRSPGHLPTVILLGYCTCIVSCRVAESVKEAVGDVHDLPSARAQFEASRSEDVKTAEDASRKSQVSRAFAGHRTSGCWPFATCAPYKMAVTRHHIKWR
jgi:hypothetical protein